MRSRHRPVMLMACMLALLAICATACSAPAGSTGTGSAGGAGSAGDTGPAGAVGSDAPDGWREGGWRDWDAADWAREAAAFFNPVIEGLWIPGRMLQGTSTDRPVDGEFEDAGVSDPEPEPVAAEPAPVSYRDNAPMVGKLFFDTPEGPSVCSATVVTDPANPGASNLVWTAGHCVHAGAKGGWFRNIVFVPSYNDEGLEGAALSGVRKSQLAPFGIWWADWAQTSPQWISEGTPSGGRGSPFDFAVLHVKKPAGSGFGSLEETVGGASRVMFDAPSATKIAGMGVWGYPASPPFDGERMFTCRGRPGRLSVRDDQPSLYRIGCTMTGGSSGGGWFIEDAKGLPALVSNTSIGPSEQTWLAGPHLGAGAKAVYESVSDKFA
ncbi:trypsin-like serine peptidase [Streptomyces sp. NPDC050509]|uniref:trypsin-like serine peptidase n=1 Tax=Streptomyces sp. NPDC050509 TaxID=3365620 RepID=UPI003797FB73